MKPWIKWVGYFFIFAFLITGIRGCVNDPNLGNTAYGFPFVYADSRHSDFPSFFKPIKIINYYETNLILNIIFWLLVFGVFYFLRNKKIFKKYSGEIKYGLVMVVILILAFLIADVYDSEIGYLAVPGLYTMIFTGGFLQDWIDKTPAASHFVYETLKNFYPYKDDLPSRFGFIFAALVYFILGVIVYRIKLWYIKRNLGKSSPK
ncbi:hypothetical protein HYX08_06520 [Candidatus Woesearchaeota archaeon]|nr:hypothetical protein [Candidatus Woesearchaeota archaeon]